MIGQDIMRVAAARCGVGVDKRGGQSGIACRRACSALTVTSCACAAVMSRALALAAGRQDASAGRPKAAGSSERGTVPVAGCDRSVLRMYSRSLSDPVVRWGAGRSSEGQFEGQNGAGER
jgi:hypothetical protein